MTQQSRIDRGMYWDEAWSLVSGCTHVSPGCDNCWSAKETHMRAKNPNEKVKARNEGLTEKGCFNGQIRLNHEFLDKPLRKKKPTVYAVWNDLFHEDVPFEFIAKAFAVMQLSQHHTFLVLTKRPERMKSFYDWLDSPEGKSVWLKTIVNVPHSDNESWSTAWPFRNIWLGVTAENQEMFDKRVPILLSIPAAIHWVSYEPALGPVNALPYLLTTGSSEPWQEERGLDWVDAGGESGSGARPCHPDWIRSMRDQCQAAGTKFFFKQWGQWLPSFDAGFRSEETDQYKRSFGDCWVKAYHQFDDGQGMVRVGKKRAGRLLDGRIWDEMPLGE